MAVDKDSVESKGLESGVINCEVVLVHGETRLTDSIDIAEDDEIVELVVAGKGSCLPDASFNDLSITSNAVDSVVDLVVVFARVSHSSSD